MTSSLRPPQPVSTPATILHPMSIPVPVPVPTPTQPQPQHVANPITATTTTTPDPIQSTNITISTATPAPTMPENPDLMVVDPSIQDSINNPTATSTVTGSPTSNSNMSDGLLIGFGGKDVIKDSWENMVLRMDDGNKENNLSNAKKFFDDFRTQHGLNFKCIDDVLIFLESAGISRHIFGRVLMNNLINIMKQRIRNMNQPQLAELLDSSYSYLTVAELAPVAVSAMEHIKHVEPSILSEIVNNGLQNSPYIDLPLQLKHKIWAHEPHAFKHEIDLILVRVSDLKNPSYTELESRPTPEMRKQNSEVLTDFLTLCTGLDDNLLAIAAEQLYEKACSDASPLRRIALANLFHDFMLMAPNRSTCTPLALIRKFARVLSGMPPTGATANIIPAGFGSSHRATANEIKTIFEHVSHSDTRAYVALLLSSSITRDYLAEQLITQLFDCRGDIKNGEDEKLMRQAQNHLRQQEILVNLVSLMLYNINGINVLLEHDIVSQDDVEQLFHQFLPLMIGEMYTDVTAKQSDHTKSVDTVANSQLIVLATQGRFERRVIASYCLFLGLHLDFPALFRQRFTLDAIMATSDPKEEARENVIASTLCRKLSEFSSLGQ